jgi:hypothetical protein
MSFWDLITRRRRAPRLTAPPMGREEMRRALWLLRGGHDTTDIAKLTGRSEAEIYNALGDAKGCHVSGFLVHDRDDAA